MAAIYSFRSNLEPACTGLTIGCYGFQSYFWTIYIYIYNIDIDVLDQ